MINYPEPADYIRSYTKEDCNALIPAEVWIDHCEKLLDELRSKLAVTEFNDICIPTRHMYKLIEYVERLQMHMTRLHEENHG